jgi:2-polyprenyl-6-methoxyphenol hydroxylase-like FAD-dependent oxidoreductase
VLVGDSAHAKSPSTGQGGSLANEGAIELARCLRDLTTVEDAFIAYEGLRRQRVEKVVGGFTAINGAQVGRIGRFLRDLLAPIAMRSTKGREQSLGWIHRYSIDWNAPVTTPAR